MSYVRKETLAEGVDLYLGDCREILSTLGHVDAVVTDPPYGIGYDSAASKASGRQSGGMLAAKRDYAATDWDTATPESGLFDVLRAISREQIIFGGNYFGLPASRCWLVWDKKVNGAFADCELAWTNLDKPVRRIEWMWNGMLRRGNEERFDHPTQKPLEVMRWCISQLSGDCNLILDPFLGSGTTGAAAVGMGRRFIGIERHEPYFDLACRRISKAVSAPDMFTPAPAIARQESLL